MAEVTIVFDAEKDLTERIVVGELRAEDILRELERFYSGKVSRLALWDFSKAAVGSITPADISRIIVVMAGYTRLRPAGRTAVIASSDLAFGFTRMYQEQRAGQKIKTAFKIFRTRREALDWLEAESE